MELDTLYKDTTFPNPQLCDLCDLQGFGKKG